MWNILSNDRELDLFQGKWGADQVDGDSGSVLRRERKNRKT